MKLICNCCIIVFVVAYCMSIFVCSCYATQGNDIQVAEEIEIPEYITVQIENTLTEKPFFNNISIREDGWFCLTTSCSEKSLGLSYDTYFADVYDPEGRFQFCIRIDGAEDIVYPELAENTLTLYFLKYFISYNLNTFEWKCFKMQEFLTESNYYKQLRQSEFTIGKKNYRCKDAFEGYTKIIVEEDGIETTLLSFPGNNRKYLPLLIPIGYAVVMVSVVIARKRKGVHSKTEA